MGKQIIRYRQAKLITIILFLTALIYGCFTFPFYFETTTSWYKFGHDKTMLHIGQTCGLLAFVFLCLQIILATRTPTLERLLGAGRRIRLHRLNGFIIAALVFFHMLLILLPEGLTNLPLGKKFWPEMLGGVLFLTIIFTVLTSQLRQKLRLNYISWKRLHKPLGYLIACGSAIHIYFVSDAFEQTIPQLLLFTIVGLVVFWIIYIKFISTQKTQGGSL